MTTFYDTVVLILGKLSSGDNAIENEIAALQAQQAEDEANLITKVNGIIAAAGIDPTAVAALQSSVSSLATRVQALETAQAADAAAQATAAAALEPAPAPAPEAPAAPAESAPAAPDAPAS